MMIFVQDIDLTSCPFAYHPHICGLFPQGKCWGAGHHARSSLVARLEQSFVHHDRRSPT